MNLLASVDYLNVMATVVHLAKARKHKVGVAPKVLNVFGYNSCFTLFSFELGMIE